MALATRSACARETNLLASGEEGGGRKSTLQPTSRMGIVGPQIERTSSIHWESTIGQQENGERVRLNVP